ncbi:MAG: HAMP domain-containing histidine kinase [Clostridia bacterium]|nr:HAMP domain-containing histidine kinase [Clostridia bacterium]
MRGSFRFFHSIAGKLFCALTACVVVLLLFNRLLNSVAFQGYYERQQTELLKQAYTVADTALQQRRDVGQALSAYIADGVGATVWSGYRLLYSNDPRLSETVFISPEEIAVPNGTYTVRTAPGQSGELRVFLLGKSTGGINIMLWLSLSGVPNGTDILNRFLWWSALATLCGGCIGVFFLARSFTRPVRQLSDMAQRMARLDFSERYESGGSHDELAQLGQSLNTVSQSMEQSLSALKTANAKLLSDVEQKNRQDEARTRFIRNVSHELKTPVSLIQNYAEGLHENVAGDAESREFYCSVIEEEAQKLSVVLRKLTLLMQLESGKEELQIEQFDIAALTARLVKRYAPLFAERAVDVPAVSEEPCLVWGDAGLLEHVLTNYLTNALHHVTEGGDIRVTFTPTDNGCVRVTVFNTGLPIPEEDIPHIWESFYKVDKARTRAYGGTGIGLSVVAAIMNAHRMPYRVENIDGGVAFSIDLSTE